MPLSPPVPYLRQDLPVIDKRSAGRHPRALSATAREEGRVSSGGGPGALFRPPPAGYLPARYFDGTAPGSTEPGRLASSRRHEPRPPCHLADGERAPHPGRPGGKRGVDFLIPLLSAQFVDGFFRHGGAFVNNLLSIKIISCKPFRFRR